jgi:hypothetical protein
MRYRRWGWFAVTKCRHAKSALNRIIPLRVPSVGATKSVAAHARYPLRLFSHSRKDIKSLQTLDFVLHG